jgi:hypothetical protein
MLAAKSTGLKSPRARSAHAYRLKHCEVGGQPPMPVRPYLHDFRVMGGKIVLLLGAGASVADVNTRSAVSRPPLDAQFFSVALRLESNDPNLTRVRSYYTKTYGIDICAPPNDSMERVMAGLYPDLFNSALEKSALPAFRALLSLFTDRLASTTNNLDATQKRFLYRIINNFLWEKVEPQDITIITFN